MAIIVISTWAEDARRELAQAVARKLGCPCLSREEVVEQATESGIPVGKMEVAVLKGTHPRERLARHKARYLAFVVKTVCEKAKQSRDLVYHGRACHLLLPGLSQLLRVGVVPDQERQVVSVMSRLNLSRDKAEHYLAEVSEDMRNWFRFAHGMDPFEPSQYDLVLNLAHLSPESAASAVCTMAQLPDFLSTPASRRALDDLSLAAKARDILGRDEATAWADLNVLAQEGRVTVTYMPRQAEVAPAITRVLAGLGEAREIVCTMALTNLLWVGERFEGSSQMFEEVTDLAQRWGAGVEIMRLLPAGEPLDACVLQETPEGELVCRPKDQDPTGGIEDDTAPADELPADDGGVAATSEQLIDHGLFAGSRVVQGGSAQITNLVKSQGHYSLVVIGDMFLDKGASTKLRQTRELAAAVTERGQVSVITADELQAKFLFGPKQMRRLGLFIILALLIYLPVFFFQRPILNFLAATDWQSWRVLATAGVVLCVPLVAYFYGGAAGLLMKWFKFE